MAARKTKTQALTMKRLVNAPVAEAYRMFTNSTALREWFCDSAQADPKKGGRLYMWWASGYYACGEFTAVAPEKRVAFTWRGRGEPEVTRVQVSFKPAKGGVQLTVTHGGIGAGPKWAKIAREFQKGWQVGLENLQSVLETGHDLRLTLRPMLGILPSDFNADIARKLGVPVTDGVRLDSTVEGMGAHAAGLQKDDVIVSLGGRKTTNTVVNALHGRRAGDRLPVVFYRGPEKKTVTMELSRRQMPDIPGSAVELAEAMRRQYAELDAELDQSLAGVTEAEAEFRPAPGEWCAKDVLAHLIIGERDGHANIVEVMESQERWADGYPANVAARHTAIFAAFPTLAALVEELKRHENETAALIAASPPEFVARKSSYWRLAYGLLQPPFHNRLHLAQIRAAVEAARKK